MINTKARNQAVKEALREIAPDLLKSGVYVDAIKIRQGRTHRLRDHTFIYVPYGTDVETRHLILDVAIKTYEENGVLFLMNNTRHDGEDYSSQYRFVVLCEDQRAPASLRTKGRAICPHCGLSFAIEGAETHAQVEGWFMNHVKIHFNHQGKLRKELLHLKGRI